MTPASTRETILVSGGVGVMGSRLVKDLVAAGHRVRALALPGDRWVSRLSGVDAEIAFGDITKPETLAAAFDGVTTVFHLAGVILSNDPSVFARVNTGGTRNMVDAARRAGVRHFVFVSSTSAIDPISEYARSKAEAEAIVRAAEPMAWTIVRPTLVYEREGGEEFLGFLRSLLKYPVVPFVGSGRARKNPVHVDDMGRGLLAIAGNPRSHGKIYNFTGGEEISIRDLARLILRHQGVSKPFLHIPLPICRAAAFLMEKTMKNPPLTRYAITRIEQDASPDNSEARRDLGYDPIGVRDGMERSFPLAGKRDSPA
ncbi:MAG TPA: NAD-dependent epimerase/dehydratase family protein [Thermoanaerobaculia bacterium]|nr:NAD-dependent epimerase/dehydratase family protein [Thermoanaerobaculia bacterium]